MAIKKTGTGDPKPQNLVMPTQAETERAISSDAPLTEIVAQMCEQIHELQARVTQMQVQQGQAAMYMPRTEIPLNRQEVEGVIREDPTAWFEAIDTYKKAGLNIAKGKLFCAQHYRNLAGHVSAGLKIMGAMPPQ